MSMQDAPTTLDPTAAHALAFLGPFFFFMVLFFLALYIIPLWQIVKKAGFHPALSLLILVPVVNIVMLYVFAFSRWRVVPAPEYPGAYPPQVPPGAYPPVYAPGTVPMTPAANNYSAPGAYVPTPPVSSTAAYPPPPTEPPTQL
ncbi:hypothetical protein [Terriglobus sp.]|uniref:hypothetical protein n=1 Tax=Terriglobus sp. TaxID=1889013 RepID=UPI003B00F325